MYNVICFYCDEQVSQYDRNSHVIERHPAPTAQESSKANFFYESYGHLLYYKQLLGKLPPLEHYLGAAFSDSADSRNMCTLFPAWREKTKLVFTQSSRCITMDDVASFRVDRSDEPRIAARSLQNSIKRDIQEFVNEFRGLGSEDLEECNDLARKLPVFACLGAYVFKHLKLCARDEPSVLDSFLRMTQEWMDKSEEWCLTNYRSIKADLSSFFEQPRAPFHSCNRQLLDSARLRYLDIHSLAALVIIYSSDQSHVQSFYAMQDDQAQAMLDLLQELIDLKSHHLDGWYERRFLDAAIRLSSKSRLYPRSLTITGVDQVVSTGDRGSFGANFRGVLPGRVVALKKLQTASRTVDEHLKDICQAAVIQRNLHHRNCLPFYGITNLIDGNVRRTYLVSPWMPNESLAVYLYRNLDVPRLPLLFDIASGLEYLHGMQPTVIHGDLNCLNTFITASGRACLANFGLVTVRDCQASVTTTDHGIYGTPGYIAPELISACERPNSATLLAQLDRRRCDMFAFGCAAYEVYSIWSSFPVTEPALHLLLCGPRLKPEMHTREPGLDDDMWMLIEQLWTPQPEARLTASSARDFLWCKLLAMGQGPPWSTDDPEWDTGFLSKPVAANDLFSL